MKQLISLLGILFVSTPLINAQASCQEEPPGGLSPLAAYSIFYENYRSGEYDLALDYGRWIICAKPEKLEGNPRYSLLTQYERMAKIYQEIARSKEDPSVKNAYVDSALTIQNEALELFGEDPEAEFDLTFDRGRFYQENYNTIDDGLQKAYADYAKLFEINPERAISLGDGYYLRQALNNIVRQGTKEEAQAFIDNVKPHAKGEALAFIEEKQQELLGSPEEQIAYYAPIVEQDPKNVDAWKALEEAYDQLDNRKKLNEVKLKINELDPTYESAMDLAEFARGNAEYQKAVKYYNQALERTDDDSEKKDLYLRIADMHINLEELGTAKGYVQDALDIDPNDGAAYIKMATIYGAAVTQCTEGRKLEASDKVVYWLVIDYLNKAKQIDPSVASTVDSQMSSFKEVTPNSEDKFFTLNLENGQTIKVDGSLNSCYSFINETTTVR